MKGSTRRISFNYEIDGKHLHYACDNISKLLRSISTDNYFAPKMDSKIINPRYKNMVFWEPPETVEELIYAIEHKARVVRDDLRQYSKNDYVRIGIYSFEEVWPNLVDVDEKKDFIRYYMNEPVSMNNARYHLFKNNPKCVCCGLEGKYLALERCKNKDEESLYHFNMYGIVNGEEVLFTKDHILPRSKGGKNILSNYQTMCSQCNAEKGNDEKISLESLRKKVLFKRERTALLDSQKEN